MAEQINTAYTSANPQGYGAPYARVFTAYGEITDNITSFTYKYHETEPDKLSVTIEAYSSKVPDKPQYQYGARWTVVWGYIMGLKTTRVVYVKDITVNYGTELVKIDIVAYDGTHSLSDATSSRTFQNASIRDVANQVGQRHNLTVTPTIGVTSAPITPRESFDLTPTRLPSDGNNIVYQNAGTGGLLPVNPNFYFDQSPYNVYIRPAQPTEDWQRNLPLINLPRYNEPGYTSDARVDAYFREVQTSIETRNESYIAIMDRYNTQGSGPSATTQDFLQTNILGRVYSEIAQGGRSDAKLLNYLARAESGSQTVVGGRDDTLSVGQRNFNQAPIRVYKYGGNAGELLEFTPENNNHANRTTASNAVQTNWDRSQKTAYQGERNFGNSGEPAMNNVSTMAISSWDAFPQNNPRNLETAIISASNDLSVPINVLRVLSLGATSSVEDLRAQTMDYLTRNTSINNTAPTHLARVNEIENYALSGDTTRVVVSPNDSSEQVISGEANHDRAEATSEKNKARGKVVGEPRIESGQVLQILNLANNHSGNYYIISSEHSITFGEGYMTTFEVSANTSPGRPNRLTGDKPVTPVRPQPAARPRTVVVSRAANPIPVEVKVNADGFVDDSQRLDDAVGYTYTKLFNPAESL